MKGRWYSCWSSHCVWTTWATWIRCEVRILFRSGVDLLATNPLVGWENSEKTRNPQIIEIIHMFIRLSTKQMAIFIKKWMEFYTVNYTPGSKLLVKNIRDEQMIPTWRPQATGGCRRKGKRPWSPGDSSDGWKTRLFRVEFWCNCWRPDCCWPCGWVSWVIRQIRW